MHGLQWMKDKSQSHFADIHLSSEQVGTPAGLISVPWSGGNYRDLTALLIRKWRPQLEKSLFYVIKNAVLVSTHACPVVQICAANALQRNAVKNDVSHAGEPHSSRGQGGRTRGSQETPKVRFSPTGPMLKCWVLNIVAVKVTDNLSLYRGQKATPPFKKKVWQNIVFLLDSPQINLGIGWSEWRWGERRWWRRWWGGST